MTSQVIGDPDTNDCGKGHAEHQALLALHRGDGAPEACKIAETRKEWMQRHLNSYYDEKQDWYKEAPGISNSL